MDPGDHDLLRDYARHGSQAAFTELVRRHLDLVYSVACRQARSSQLAEDVAQSVFLDLARHARRINPTTPLVAWLHVVTRRTAIDVLRREIRRQQREQAAAALAMPPSPSATWSAIASLLDEAVASLPDRDRAAIVLRYFENKSLRDVGAALSTNDDAAQKRVSRAVEQLRAFFLRRGIAVTAAGLAEELGAHAVITAPATLASALTTPAFLFNVTSTAALAMTTVQKSAALLAAAVFAGFGAYEVARTRHSPIETARPDIRAAVRANPPRAAAGAREPATTAGTDAGPASPGKTDAPGMADARVALLRQLLAELPAQRLPELRLLDAKDWLAIAEKHELDSASDIRLALAELRAVARRNIADALKEALRRYTDGSDGHLPGEVTQLAPFLPASIDAEMLARYEMVRTGRLAEPSEKLVREKATSDLILSVGLGGWGVTNNSDLPAAMGESEAAALARISRAVATATDDDTEAQAKQAAAFTAVATSVSDAMKSLGPDYRDEMKRAAAAFVAAHPDETITNAVQLLPFLKDSDRFVAAFRPVFAQLDYAREHDGQTPASPEQLRPYLARPFSAAEALRAVKLTLDHERLDFDFDYSGDAPGKP